MRKSRDDKANATLIRAKALSTSGAPTWDPTSSSAGGGGGGGRPRPVRRRSSGATPRAKRSLDRPGQVHREPRGNSSRLGGNDRAARTHLGLARAARTARKRPCTLLPRIRRATEGDVKYGSSRGRRTASVTNGRRAHRVRCRAARRQVHGRVARYSGLLACILGRASCGAA